MEISRRKFFFFGLAAGVGLFLPEVKIKLAIDKLFIPTTKQIEFLASDKPISLYGIPYHVSNCSGGQWLGINRQSSPETTKAIIEMVKLLQADKLNDSIN